MTEGRFESSWVDPRWQNRKFWASGTSYKDDPPVGSLSTRSATGKTHSRQPYSCDEDHRQRESCPFHDLRASGCFQYEGGLHERHQATVEPSKLTARAGGQAMRTCGAGENKNSRRGVGGTLLPCDTDVAVGPGPLRGGGPWTSTGKKGRLNNGLFSSYPHEPGDFTLRPTNVFSNEKGGLAAPFRSGSKHVGAIGKSFPHQPDVYPAGARHAPHWRLKSGKGRDPYRFPHAPEGGPAGGDEAGKARRRDITSRMNKSALPFVPDKSVRGTFGKFPPHLPDPCPSKQIREYRPPIFTYHAHQKRTAPVIVPWAEGPQTADPAVDSAGVGSVELKSQNTARQSVRSLAVTQ